MICRVDKLRIILFRHKVVSVYFLPTIEKEKPQSKFWDLSQVGNQFLVSGIFDLSSKAECRKLTPFFPPLLGVT